MLWYNKYYLYNLFFLLYNFIIYIDCDHQCKNCHGTADNCVECEIRRDPIPTCGCKANMAEDSSLVCNCNPGFYPDASDNC